MTLAFRVFASSMWQVTAIPLAGLTPVGGAGSSGIELPGLKHKGDYVILAPNQDGVALHPLRSRLGTGKSLRPGDAVSIDDLTIFVVPDIQTEAQVGTATVASTHGESDETTFELILKQMAKSATSEHALGEVLRVVMAIAKHEKGLVITRNEMDRYELLIANNLEASEAWLSESLVTAALREKKPILLQNVIGSSFDANASVVATGFLSVFCWPLLIQGQTHGLIVTGSQRPHSGLTRGEHARIEAFAHLGALVTHFRLKELNLQRALQQMRLTRGDSPLLTQDANLLSTCELARKISSADLAVLVQGETGVGKEVLSRWIHEQSDRRDKPFVAVNCSAIPHDLLESVLFGHKKGSFTGAANDQIGKIQQADGGTLFLDEIGDLPLALQAKFLRVLQDKCVEPVGASKPVKVDVRLISATHKNLKNLVSHGAFREDLYYRLAEMTLWIPPLRERPGDIRLLAGQFLKDTAPAKQFTTRGWAWLLNQPWSGNARELKAAVKRAALLSGKDEIDDGCFLLGSEIRREGISWVSPEKSWLGAETLEKAKQLFVMRKIQLALELTEGNRTHAAQLLGITARTLFRYLEDETMKDVSQPL